MRDDIDIPEVTAFDALPGAPIGRKLNPKAIGERSEAIVLGALARAGEDVAVPFGDNLRYDILVDRGDRIIRIQVKTGRLAKRGHSAGTIVFPTCSSQRHRGGPSIPYHGQADYFGVYCPETDGVYYVPVDECGNRQAVLRVSPPLRQQRRSNLRWARDYERLP